MNKDVVFAEPLLPSSRGFLCIPPVKEARLVGIREKTFSVAGPHLTPGFWNSLLWDALLASSLLPGGEGGTTLKNRTFQVVFYRLDCVVFFR